MLLFWDLIEDKTLLMTSSLKDSSSNTVIFYTSKVINALKIDIRTCL